MKHNAQRIEIGDHVDVFWEHIEPLYDVEVTYTPQATGDCWIFNIGDGRVAYVQTFSRMIKPSSYAPKE